MAGCPCCEQFRLFLFHETVGVFDHSTPPPFGKKKPDGDSAPLWGVVKRISGKVTAILIGAMLRLERSPPIPLLQSGLLRASRAAGKVVLNLYAHNSALPGGNKSVYISEPGVAYGWWCVAAAARHRFCGGTVKHPPKGSIRRACGSGEGG